MNPRAAACLLVGFVVVIGAYVALTLTGHDAAGLVSAVVTLLGVTGLGVHIERRTQEQNATIAKIDRQTNGILTQRIQDGVSAALVAHKLIPEQPAPPVQ